MQTRIGTNYEALQRKSNSVVDDLHDGSLDELDSVGPPIVVEAIEESDLRGGELTHRQRLGLLYWAFCYVSLSHRDTSLRVDRMMAAS
ncbi:hypothetical protein ACIBJI_23970 [Nocardia sp. NPDC050408]|uniref:hypothetical protein n=1 Tax=Nocardia sp. NPDC050408 TaxID=3364319 RepID=UPI0037915ED8